MGRARRERQPRQPTREVHLGFELSAKSGVASVVDREPHHRDRPGEWMYHCHILEHHASGMMGHFAVVRE